jgi:hypothetical protein
MRSDFVAVERAWNLAAKEEVVWAAASGSKKSRGRQRERNCSRFA